MKSTALIALALVAIAKGQSPVAAPVTAPVAAAAQVHPCGADDAMNVLAPGLINMGMIPAGSNGTFACEFGEGTFGCDFDLSGASADAPAGMLLKYMCPTTCGLAANNTECITYWTELSSRTDAPSGAPVVSPPVAAPAPVAAPVAASAPVAAPAVAAPTAALSGASRAATAATVVVGAAVAALFTR